MQFFQTYATLWQVLSFNMANNILNILLIDDDAEYYALVKHHLSSWSNKKFELTWVQTSEKAFDHLRNSQNVDIILMDYYLPNTSGLEITKKIIDDKFTIPIIFLTTNKDLHIAIEAIKFGIEDYLIKDEMTETLLPRTIVNVFERAQLRKNVNEAEKEKLLSQKKSEAIQELIVTMCHEFNNPLAAVKISTDILSRQSIPQEDKELLQKLNADISILEKQIIRLRDLKSEKEN